MFDQVVAAIEAYPYIGIALAFLLCGLGFPLPEEIVLLAAGYVCAEFPEKARLAPMMAWCGGAILVGDLIPFLLGRLFGVRLLRLRWLRYFITQQRLASFDRWFRRRGDLVIVISRFLAGLRVVAFFTAGAMKMRWLRFLFLDGIGIVLMVPLLTWVGFRSAEVIRDAIDKVQQVERGILWGAVGASLLLAVWLWWWRRRREARKKRPLTETFVQPKRPVQEPLLAEVPPHVPESIRPDSPRADAFGTEPAAAESGPLDASTEDDAAPGDREAERNS